MHTRKRMVTLLVGAAFAAVAMGAQDADNLGLPLVPIPLDNPLTAEKVELGKRIFLDTRFSADGIVSCATCHQPDRAFSDGLPKSKGIRAQIGTRNAPSLLNAGFMETQFWDGRRTTLESQVLDPFVNSREHGLASSAQLIELVQQDPAYVSLFKVAFDTDMQPVSEQNIAKALASYLRTLTAGSSPFDRFYYAGDQTALSASARRGLKLFLGRAQCATCHQIGGAEASFTDQKFHSLHVGMDQIEGRLPELTKRAVAARRSNLSADSTVLSDEDVSELGRFFVTLNPADIGQFRTPSLRNVALTAPYMHDGSIGSLKQAVEQEIYYRSAQNGRPIILTPEEKADLVRFLQNLTGGVRDATTNAGD